MNLRPFLFAAVFVPASASFAAVGDPCVVATFEGACNGTKISFCDDTDAAAPVEDEIECGTFGGITGGTCETFSYGANCAVPDGEGCFFTTPDGTTSLRLPCSTDSSACVAGVCEASTSCTPPGEDDETPVTCTGDLQDFGCTAEGQHFQLDCPTLAFITGAGEANITATSTCTESGTEVVCGGVAAGDACADGVFECAAGLFCNGDTDTTFGSCGATDTDVGGEGEGEGEDDDGGRRDDEAEDAPGGLCSTTGTMDASFGFALLGLVAVRRRRR